MLYSPMVIICTSSLPFNNSTFCPHCVFMCFVWISEQTATISLYNINWLVFITDTQCIYCAVRTGYLCLIQFQFTIQGRAITQAVTHHASRCDTYSPDKLPLSQMSVPALPHSHVSISPPVLYSSYLHVVFTWTRQRRRTETFQKVTHFCKSGGRSMANFVRLRGAKLNIYYKYIIT
jgi:hypothetical protein